MDRSSAPGPRNPMEAFERGYPPPPGGAEAGSRSPGDARRLTSPACLPPPGRSSRAISGRRRKWRRLAAAWHLLDSRAWWSPHSPARRRWWPCTSPAPGGVRCMAVTVMSTPTGSCEPSRLTRDTCAGRRRRSRSGGRHWPLASAPVGRTSAWTHGTDTLSAVVRCAVNWWRYVRRLV